LANPNPDTSGLRQFSSTYQPKKNGRKPSVIKKAIKDNGISMDDMMHCFRYVMGKSREELQDIIKDPKESIVIVSAATAMLKDLSKGSLANISTVMRKANIDPEQSAGKSGGGSGPDLGGADTSDHSQFHEYSFPEADPLPE
jgi:hypothetical protein